MSKLKPRTPSVRTQNVRSARPKNFKPVLRLTALRSDAKRVDYLTSAARGSKAKVSRTTTVIEVDAKGRAAVQTTYVHDDRVRVTPWRMSRWAWTPEDTEGWLPRVLRG